MQFKRTSLLTKLLITLLAVSAIVALLTLWDLLSEKQQEAAELEQQIAETKAENQRLQDAIDAVGTEDGLADMARDELGMAQEDEIIFYDIGG